MVLPRLGLWYRAGVRDSRALGRRGGLTPGSRRVLTRAEAGRVWQVWIDLSCSCFSVLGQIFVISSAFFVLTVCLLLERFRKKLYLSLKNQDSKANTVSSVF